MADEPTLDELMAVVMARQINDGDFIAHGASVPLAAAALMMAKELHAPGVDFFYQGTLTTAERDPANLMLDIERIYDSAPSFLSQAQITDFEMRGGGDFQFLRPIQIDREGSVNTSLIGTLEKPVQRFHGIAVADAMSIVKRICLYVTEHSKRVFVEQLSYRTGLGNVDGGLWRERLGLPGGGPTVVVTPLAVMDFGGEAGTMRLAALMPGVSEESVRENTGFDFEAVDDLGEVDPPGEDELETLRRVDPLATRQLEFREWRAAARERIARERPGATF